MIDPVKNDLAFSYVLEEDESLAGDKDTFVVAVIAVFRETSSAANVSGMAYPSAGEIVSEVDVELPVAPMSFVDVGLSSSIYCSLELEIDTADRTQLDWTPVAVIVVVEIAT
jgi:hypothetical protein